MRLQFTGLVLALALLPALQGAGDPLTVQELISRGELRFQQLTDYECMTDLESRLGSKTDTGICRFWYKQPGMFRVRSVRGQHQGSEVVRNAQGDLYARKGGLLKAFSKRLQPTDSRVSNLRGTPVNELVWGTIYRRLRERMARPGTRVVLAAPSRPGDPYEIALGYAENGKQIRQICRVDAQQWLPTEVQVVENGVVVERAAFRDVRLNGGLKDKWFRF
jgi:outer membrane lipoprotein-sorting protein